MNNSEEESPLFCDQIDDEDYTIVDNISNTLAGYVTISVSAFGIIANILAIIIFTKKAFRSNFNNLLICLAVCDALVLMFSIIESLRRTVQPHLGDPSTVSGRLTQIHHLLLPHFLFPFHNILISTSIFLTISISIERYLSLFHPQVYKRRGGVGIFCCHTIPVLVFSICLNIPLFMVTKVVINEDNSTMIGPTDLRMNYHYAYIYQHWVRFILLGILPFFSLLLLNSKIIFKINRFSRERGGGSVDKSYSIILALIVLIFLICHSPRILINIIETLGAETDVKYFQITFILRV